jgi:hypothetical protein
VPYKDPIKQAAFQRKRHKKRRDRLREIKCEAKDRPCMDCGVQYPCYVMQFDHLRDKSFGLAGASIISVSDEELLAEIEKCDVVCANCHAERTYQRGKGGVPGESLQDSSL